MRRSLWAVSGCVLALAALLWWAGDAQAGRKASAVPLDVVLYDSTVDEQDTTSFYDNGIAYCSGSSTASWTSALAGDNGVAGPPYAYGMGAPWTLSGPWTSTQYTNATFCGTSCLRAQLNSDSKILTLDTRGTSPGREVELDFSAPCTDPGCPPAGSATVLGGGLSTPGLLNVGLTFPYTSMDECSSTACPEAQPAFAKFWFTDPNDSSVTWRVDWQYLRVLRMSADTWYVIADSCDGTQIAGLSKLQGNRTKPKAVFNGSYKMPFLLTATRK